MRYIFNPGDFLDVQTSEHPAAFSGRNYGELFRVEGARLERFDRVTANWYVVEADEQPFLQIKVLRAAGLHP